MAPQRKRENRENNFYNVGVQGRKTGITLEDRGIYDEHGLEPVSGIFSSPEKSPPKRGGNNTASESMDIQESSIPELTTSHQILRNSRTHLPPPRSRSPKKTMLGSSPRRQSSIVPRGSSIGIPSSPTRAVSHPVARRLDFEQDESSLQETPALSGSGARRGKRNNVYDIPEDESPEPQYQHDTILEESMVQEEITANEDSAAYNAVPEESFAGQVGDETMTGADTIADETVQEEAEIEPEPVVQPAKRGRKRKSNVLEPAVQAEASPPKARKRGPAAAKPAEGQKSSSKHTAALATQRRRSNRTSDVTEQDPSILNSLLDDSEQNPAPAEENPAPVKRRGRPPKVQPIPGKENNVPAKALKNTKSVAPAKEKADTTFKKPAKPAPKPKSKDKSVAQSKTGKPSKEKTSSADAEEAGKLVDVYGHPLSKQDIEQMSTISTTSRYGRGRHLSVYREMDPDAMARVGRTGRHRVAPIDFWNNEGIAYSTDGSMTAIVKNQDTEPERKRTKYRSGTKGKKRILPAIEEEEVELDPWEEDGVLVANFKDYDAETGMLTEDIITDREIAWAPSGLQLVEVADGSFNFKKIGSAIGNGDWFNWGMIELKADQMKRSKNSRRMHMVFTVQSGTVEVRVSDNEFIVHRNGIWQVPRGNSYSIKNIGSTTARMFFAQASQEPQVQA